MERKFTTGADKSEYDIRTFTYAPDKANISGGTRWEEKDIEDQHAVGICTGISTVMRAQKFFNKKFSPEFQYLCQKKFYDNNWYEGSSILNAIKVGKDIGFLPVEAWTYTTEEDRKLPYAQYIAKLQAVPDADINAMKVAANSYKIKAYASVPVSRDYLANAVDSEGALLTRFVVGSEWWTEPLQPLRKAVAPISGHAVNYTNYDGLSYRIANSWGVNWADKGTAYSLLNKYSPTEAWEVWFDTIPEVINKQIESRDSIVGKILDLLQQIIVLVTKLK